MAHAGALLPSGFPVQLAAFALCMAPISVLSLLLPVAKCPLVGSAAVG